MTPLEVIDIGRDALWTLIMVAAPVMGVALFVGLLIALFQALTQIQEMTLTFVPKIIAIFFTMMLVLPYMFQTLSDFYEELMSRISDPGRVAEIPIMTKEEEEKQNPAPPELRDEPLRR
ncbi:MAG: flagellar biosynthesis protein FliQ [Rickettsiales bacterium]|nr:flagellar biosynthesis protein FliQ [Rickettsiales bacterium]